MLKSMTGFGRGEYEDEQFSVTIEMKTVNHRYNEVAIRLPRFLNPVEDRIRKTILKSVNRGRIDVFINPSYSSTENVSIKVDKALVLAYHNALRDVGSAISCEDYKLNEQSEILYLSRCPDVIMHKKVFLTLRVFGRSWNRLCVRLSVILSLCVRPRAVISMVISLNVPI